MKRLRKIKQQLDVYDGSTMQSTMSNLNPNDVGGSITNTNVQSTNTPTNTPTNTHISRLASTLQNISLQPKRPKYINF